MRKGLVLCELPVLMVAGIIGRAAGRGASGTRRGTRTTSPTTETAETEIAIEMATGEGLTVSEPVNSGE